MAELLVGLLQEVECKNYLDRNTKLKDAEVLDDLTNILVSEPQSEVVCSCYSAVNNKVMLTLSANGVVKKSTVAHARLIWKHLQDFTGVKDPQIYPAKEGDLHPQVVEFKRLAYKFSSQRLLRLLAKRRGGTSGFNSLESDYKRLAGSKNKDELMKYLQDSLKKILGLLCGLLGKHGDQLRKGKGFDDLIIILDAIDLNVYFLFKNVRQVQYLGKWMHCHGCLLTAN